MNEEISYLIEPIYVCECGEFVYSRDNLFLITLKGKPLDERYKNVCKKCYLEHKEKNSNIIDMHGSVNKHESWKNKRTIK